MNLFKKKMQMPKQHFCLVRWSTIAEDYSIGFDSLKKIFHFKGGIVLNIENYSPVKIWELSRNKIPVFDLTEGEDVPMRSKFVPETEVALSVIQLYGRTIK